MSTKKQLESIRESCEGHLFTFARVVEPHRVYGEVHEELFNWWQFKAGDNSLALIPRDHQKSHMIAVLCAWLITKFPWITILYLSATSNLAEKQLGDIKRILTCKEYRRLWPDMVHHDKGQREMWNNNEICVDHPDRAKEGVRDSTVFTAGLTTTTTGLHAQILIKDDVVVPENAYTMTGRNNVKSGSSQMASILTTDGKEYVVGTRYHEKDHYNDLKKMKEEVYNDEGDVISERAVYRTFERVVETEGRFLWPRQARADGKMFGFDWQQLARKKAKYLIRSQFHAQYYNDPNSVENQKITNANFQYYKRDHLQMKSGYWYIKHKKLNVYAGMDFAGSLKKGADYSCVVVIGLDYEGNVYILDIDRFKTVKMDAYFQAVFRMHGKWGFDWIRPEISSQQNVLVEYVKDQCKLKSMSLKFDPVRHSPSEGSKQERMDASLNPRYENMQMYHYLGGMNEVLEEELTLEHPPHDDVKDTLAIVCSWNKLTRPRAPRRDDERSVHYLQAHNRFGGVA